MYPNSKIVKANKKVLAPGLKGDNFVVFRTAYILLGIT
jgi:hypothetical protein